MPNARVFVNAAFVAALAACAVPPPAGPSGRHLVYRDSGGTPIRQFDYPTQDFCKRVEGAAGRSARCQADPVTGLQSRATLRYNPPGVLVEAHYSDLARCRNDTSSLAPGVQLIKACAANSP